MRYIGHKINPCLSSQKIIDFFLRSVRDSQSLLVLAFEPSSHLATYAARRSGFASSRHSSSALVLRSGRAILDLSSLRLERVQLVHGFGNIAVNQ